LVCLALIHDAGRSQTNVSAGLYDIMAITAGDHYSVALKSSYHFGGFLGPLNASPIVNMLKTGAAVPVRFKLGSNQGLDSGL
jgi:hypothetical protein